MTAAVWPAAARVVEFSCPLFSSGLLDLQPQIVSINRWLAFRPGLPAAVNPQPLIRVLPHVGLENPVEVLCIFQHVAGEIAGIDQFDGGIEAEPMFLEIFVPDQKTGNHCCARPQRKQGDGWCRCGRYSEKICEYALASR